MIGFIAIPERGIASPGTELAAIKTHVQQIMDRCRTLKSSSRKRLTSIKEAAADQKQRRVITQLQSKIPFVCNEVNASGYAILEYANRLSKNCLACLGGDGLCQPDQARRCQSDSEALSDKNYDFTLYQQNLKKLIETYNNVVSQTGRNPHAAEKPKVRAVAKDKEVRQIRKRLAASMLKVERQRERCGHLKRKSATSSRLLTACRVMLKESQNFLTIAGQLNYECLLCIRGGRCKSKERFSACREIWSKYAAAEELMAAAHAQVVSSMPIPKVKSRNADVDSKTNPGQTLDKSSQPSVGMETPKKSTLVRLQSRSNADASTTNRRNGDVKIKSTVPMTATNVFSDRKSRRERTYPKFGPGPWAHFGSFLNEYNARNLTKRLEEHQGHFPNKQLRYDRELVKKKKRPDGVYYFRVRIGPFASKSEVLTFCRVMKDSAKLDTCKTGKPPIAR